MQPLLMFSSAVVPGLILMWYLHTRERFPQPRTTLWATFGLGALITLPVIVLFFPLSIVLSVIASSTGNALLFTLVQAFLTSAILQETFKYLVLANFSCQRKRLAEPFDGVVYGVVASLGIATLECIAYVSEGDVTGALLRAFTSVPLHCALGAIMGYYIARSVFDPTPWSRRLLLAYVVPVVLHGLYDFPLLLGALPLVPLSFVVLIGALIWAVKLVRRVQSSQRRRSLAIWGELGSRPGQFSSPHSIALDQQGNLYVADTLNNRVQKLSSAGDSVAEWGTTGHRPGEFRSLRALTVDASGQIIVADTLNHRIQILSAEGQPLAQWGEQGAKSGQFRTPSGVAVDSAGDIYVADTGNHRIQKFSPEGALLSVWGSNGGEPGEFRAPVGIALDADGWMYVTDSGNHRVQKLSPEGEPSEQWGEEGTEPGQFRNPSGISLDSRRRIYVADTWNNRVQELSTAGESLSQWGLQVAGQQGQFADPCGIAIDERDHVFVADTGNHRIHKLHPFSALYSSANAAEDSPTGEEPAEEEPQESQQAN